MKLLVWLATSAAIVLSGCNRTGVEVPPGQIAARVNGAPIAIGQVQSAAARTEASREQARQATAGALERLIDQELLAQEALKAGLDRDPAVRQALDNARRHILARAYLDRAAGAASVESREAVGRFYRENPALFEARRIYRVLELAVAVPRDKLADVRAQSASAKTLDEVAAWLETKQLPFNITAASRPAEAISMQVLPQMHRMREGQIAVFATHGGASVVQLVGSTAAPLSEQQAAPVIARYLLNMRRLEVARAELEKLRERAAIEYVGSFGAARAAAPAPPDAARAAAEQGIDAPRVARNTSIRG